MDLFTTQILVCALLAAAGIVLSGALLVSLRRSKSKPPEANRWVVTIISFLGALAVWALILPALVIYWPGAELPQPQQISVPATPATPARTTFTPDEVRIGNWIFTYLNGVATVLFFGGLFGAVFGAVRKWRTSHIWYLAAFGMVGAYVIWDLGVFLALHVYQPGISRHILPKDYGDQPGVVAAWFCAFLWAIMVSGIAEGVRKLRRACLRRFGRTASS